MPEARRDARAERRARDLLASVAGPEALAMYEELGFLAVDGGEGYGYLIYPHRPIVAYDAASGELLSEYCVGFPDPDGSDRRGGACPTPTTCWRSGWRSGATSEA